MRQSLRERIELSLDDRQVAALAVGALLLLAGMFALGLLVGMQVVRRSALPPPMGDLAALDLQRSQAPRSASAASSEPRAQVPAPQQDSRSAAPPAPGAERPAQTAVASVPARFDPPPKKDLPAPPATVDIAPPRPVAVAPAESEVPLPAPPARLGAYTVQLGASQHRAEALQLASRAASAGLKPYVVQARLPAKDGVWYRVRVGAFSDKHSAERYRRDVDRELRTSAVVMPTR